MQYFIKESLFAPDLPMQFLPSLYNGPNRILHVTGWVFKEVARLKIENVVCLKGGGVAQWLGRRISDQGVPGSNPSRCTFRCGLEQVTFTLLSTG